MPNAAIELLFDPVIQLGPLGLRWQTLGVTLALLVALGLVARVANHLPPVGPESAQPQGPRAPLRVDDLAYIVVGIVPGAVLGGRLAHGLAHWSAYAAEPLRLLDPGLGSLSLTGAVVGGTLSALYVAFLLGAPRQRWLDAAAVPLLLAIGLGKLAQLLGGSGQGLALDAPFAVAFLGDGPWHSLNPAQPAHPAQVYEALLMLVGIPVAMALAGAGAETRRLLPAPLAAAYARERAPGMLFAVALAWFLVMRVAVGFAWRDEDVLGPMNAEQMLALVLLAALLGGMALRRFVERDRATGQEGG